MTRKEFINRAKEKYGEQFDYKYIIDNKLEMYSTVPILCNKHGLFYSTVYDMLNGETCFECMRDEINKDFSKK